jgi:LAO/AO transport system kinase
LADHDQLATAQLANALRAGDRQALARAITLVESRRDADRLLAGRLLAALLPHTGGALRLGITGAPGVGKSTLIEALGTRLCARGRKVAVLAVDPSSTVTGGSILGDKTRMSGLSRAENSFIRPQPAGDAAGGVAAATREALLCCEAAGFDVAIVETIGTGQSETAVASMVDFFLLVLSPTAGDELQGIKRGVMELCDGIFVHKADGDLAAAADRAAQQVLLAMRVLRAGGRELPPVLLGSSATGRGIDELWQAVEGRVATARASGALERRRSEQRTSWLDAALRLQLTESFFADPRVQAALPEARAAVAAGRELPTAAAARLLALRAAP